MTVAHNNLFSSVSTTLSATPSLAVGKYPKAVSESIPPPGFTPRATTVMDSHAFLFNVMTSKDDVDELEELDRRRLEMIASLLTSYSDYFTEIIRNKYGSRRVKKLLGKSDDVDAFICVALVCNFFHIMTDKYASHVAVRAMAVFDRDKRNALYEHALDHAFDLARDQYGSIALNEIITDSGDGCFRDQILELIALNALYLSHDDSGNFVVQHAFKLDDLRCTHNITVSLSGHFVELSFTKYGSYIVEKILAAREEPMVEVVVELLNCEEDELMRLATNEFGNFVVSKALKVTREEMETASYFLTLVSKLVPFLHLLRNSHGSDIADTIESLSYVRR